jgi:hypothetical protein
VVRKSHNRVCEAHPCQRPLRSAKYPKSYGVIVCEAYLSNWLRSLTMLKYIPNADLSEWLRSLTRNQMGISRAGSNPAVSEIFFLEVPKSFIVSWVCCAHPKYEKNLNVAF